MECTDDGRRKTTWEALKLLDMALMGRNPYPAQTFELSAESRVRMHAFVRRLHETGQLAHLKR